MPPKDYFIANPAMKAAQLAIEFRLHGPWATFTSLHSGFQQAVHQAKRDLSRGIVPAALVGAFFGLDDPAELWAAEDRTYCEAIWTQYARDPAELVNISDCWGKYGPLTSELGRLMR
jgi:3-oxoacyl-(acyl-carrier-protein) synthase